MLIFYFCFLVLLIFVYEKSLSLERCKFPVYQKPQMRKRLSFLFTKFALSLASVTRAGDYGSSVMSFPKIHMLAITILHNNLIQQSHGLNFIQIVTKG